jgi:hypothetical protein
VPKAGAVTQAALSLFVDKMGSETLNMAQTAPKNKNGGFDSPFFGLLSWIDLAARCGCFSHLFEPIHHVFAVPATINFDHRGFRYDGLAKQRCGGAYHGSIAI